ncbi:MAG: spondin domain-containing protein, partial [Gammaproteobacteria bacterium]|nr:spondin domain-containing protein [Gammaproteobacteria bacterium]
MEKKQTMRRFAGIFGLSVCLCAPLHAQDSATYEMTFQGLWTADDITDSSLPSGAHFTEVIGAKHNSSTRIWRRGGIASEGVEGVAEFGSTGTLRSEINSNANTDGIISAGSTNNGPISAVSTTFNINSSHPLVSVLSMIAPTSDWFVGIDSEPLRQNGAWRDRVQLDLYPYDAGTENGNAWSLGGGNVDPHETITSIRNTGRFRDNPLARITFQLQTPAASNVSIADASVAEGDSGETDLSFTVQLDRASSGDISLDWATSTATGDTAAEGADYTAANGSLTFSAGEMSKSVTVKVQGDTQAESNETFTVTLSNLAGNGTLPSPATATGTIIDDDAAPPPATAGVTAAQPSDTMVAEGDTTNTATFTVVLDSQPSSAVTVTVTAAAGLELDGPDSSAAFTASEALAFAANAWDSAQTVTVRATDDSTDSPSGRELAVTYRTASSDSAYSGLAGTAATVAVTDDDATTATLAGASGNIEEGATKTFTVTLSRALAGGETLAVPLTFSGTAARNADYTVACASAAGVACANLNTGSNPRVTFTGPAAASVTLTLTADDDSAGETVDIGLGTLNAASGTGLDGGASGADNLAIFSIIAPAPTDTTAPTLSISGVPERINDRAPFTATFSFSEAVTGFDATDVTVDGGTAGALSGSGDAYTMTITPTGGANVTVTVAADAATDGSNNSGPETAVSETAAWDPGSLAVSEASLMLDEGGSASYTVALDTEPSGPVTVAIAAPDGAGVELSPSSLVFDADDWDTPQRVTVSALEDDDLADESGILSHSASGGGYDGVSAEVSVAVSDDDMASLAVSESSLALDEGGSATYTVALGARPSGDVTVAVAVSGGGVEVSPDSLTFSANNWSAAQSVTVTALEDDDVADASASLAHSASGGSYDGVSAEVAVAVTDNDEGSLAVSESSLALDEGGSATYTVALGARPSGDVTVA